MWARVDDHFDEHKKVFIAGERLGGPNATGRVLAIWLEGRLWSNRNNTLGFVPMNIVKRFHHDDDPLQVAAALSAPLTDDERLRWNTDSENCLWIQEGSGYRFHDDEHYRPKKDPAEVRDARAEAGRRGGQVSAERRKQTKQPSKQIATDDGQQTKQTEQQFAAPVLDGPPRKLLQNEPEDGKQTKQPSKQNSNPVSRIPVPGTDLPGETHTARASRGPLVTPPAKLRNVRFFSESGLHVPNFLHDTEFRPRLMSGGITEREADQQLDSWYAEVQAKFASTVVGDEPLQFWRKRFAEWLGTTTKAAPSVESPAPAEHGTAKKRYGGYQW